MDSGDSVCVARKSKRDSWSVCLSVCQFVGFSVCRYVARERGVVIHRELEERNGRLGMSCLVMDEMNRHLSQ